MKIAIFESSEHGYKMIRGAEDEKYFEEYVRISEYVDVQFPPRSLDELIPAQIAAIDKKIAEVLAKSHAEVQELKATRADLLAIGYDKAVA